MTIKQSAISGYINMLSSPAVIPEAATIKRDISLRSVFNSDVKFWTFINPDRTFLFTLPF